MNKETQPAEVGDQIQILELHPSDAFKEDEELYTGKTFIVGRVYNLFYIKHPDGNRHGFLDIDGYPYYTIHKRAKDVTKNK